MRADADDVMIKAARRKLAFARLDQVMPEVDRLLAGHTTVGNWSLGQICDHLARGISCTLDGFSERAPWLFRKTVGPFFLRWIVWQGRFPQGVKLSEKDLPKPGTDAREAAESLRAALERLTAHSGPLAEHPLAGSVSRATWERFHCIHCAHHLSFALPVERS